MTLKKKSCMKKNNVARDMDSMRSLNDWFLKFCADPFLEESKKLFHFSLLKGPNKLLEDIYWITVTLVFDVKTLNIL